MPTLLPGEEAPESLEKLLSVVAVPEQADTFRSLSKGIRAGNVQAIAYGGYVQGIVINAAAATLPPVSEKQAKPFGLYGYHGVFLGPTMSTSHVSLHVTRVRSTRTFQTRQVVARQEQTQGDKKLTRDVFYAVVDFHALEPPAMAYSPPPALKYTLPEDCPDYREHIASRIANKTLHPGIAKVLDETFGSFDTLEDRRLCPEGVGFQNVWGIDSAAQTTQQDRPLVERTTAWWIRSSKPFSDHASGANMHRAALAFILDAATSFIPLTHSNRPLTDAAAASSLDGTVRFVNGDFRIDDWTLIEIRCEAAGDGRTVPVSKAWRRDGTLIAEASQNCIMRLRSKAAPKI